MTICFTLPYSSGGCEERRIKFDLLTAIIKCSLLAPIKGRGLMLTWLTLMQPRHASALPFFFLFVFSPFTRLTLSPLRVSACVSPTELGMEMRGWLWLNICFAYMQMEKGQWKKQISFFGCKTSSARGEGQIYGIQVVEFTILPALALSALFLRPQWYYYNESVFLKLRPQVANARRSTLGTHFTNYYETQKTSTSAQK